MKTDQAVLGSRFLKQYTNVVNRLNDADKKNKVITLKEISKIPLNKKTNSRNWKMPQISLFSFKSLLEKRVKIQTRLINLNAVRNVVDSIFPKNLKQSNKTVDLRGGLLEKIKDLSKNDKKELFACNSKIIANGSSLTSVVIMSLLAVSYLTSYRLPQRVTGISLICFGGVSIVSCIAGMVVKLCMKDLKEINTNKNKIFPDEGALKKLLEEKVKATKILSSRPTDLKGWNSIQKEVKLKSILICSPMIFQELMEKQFKDLLAITTTNDKDFISKMNGVMNLFKESKNGKYLNCNYKFLRAIFKAKVDQLAKQAVNEAFKNLNVFLEKWNTEDYNSKEDCLNDLYRVLIFKNKAEELIACAEQSFNFDENTNSYKAGKKEWTYEESSHREKIKKISWKDLKTLTIPQKKKK